MSNCPQVRPASRRGFALIAATWIIIVMVAITLILAHRMRVETMASANQVARLQADAVERGAEQYVLAVVDNSNGASLGVTSAPAAAVPLGDGYFWILHPDPNDSANYAFGIADEAAKLNLNAAGADMLMALSSGIDISIADSISTWHSAPGTVTANGAGDSYYMALPQPYHCKSANFESIEELLLVRDVTPDLLFGADTNRDGVIDPGESASANVGQSLNISQDDPRGIAPFVTAWTVEANSTSSSSPRINVNDRNTSQLNTYLQQTLSTGRAASIMTMVAIANATRGTRGQTFSNIFDFYFRAGLAPDEFNKIVDRLTTTARPASGAPSTRTGLINVNTAPRQVLRCLPGLNDTDATSLITARKAVTDPTNTLAWVVTALPREKLIPIGNLITSRSYQFSADIVGVSGDGRAYKRVRIVVDARQSPPTLLYRKDLTDLGWPLDPAIRNSLRSEKSIGAGNQPGAIRGAL